MGKRVKPKCKRCAGKGWRLIGGCDGKIRSCGACKRYKDDLAELNALLCASAFQPRLLAFVDAVARLKHEREPDYTGDVHEPTAEDAITTLNEIILKARQLLGMAEKCDACGDSVAYIIVCPDGTEICQDCFDAGQH